MKYPIVILHGWRKQGKDYAELQGLLAQKGYAVFAPDMPGFGIEKLTKPVMHIDDYVVFVLDFLKKKKLKKVILIGHSFGGRVGAKLTAEHPEVVEKLILTGAPLIKQKLSLKNRMLVLVARLTKKSLRFLFGGARMRKVLYYLLGEWDYYKASPELRETFKAVIAEDIAPNLPLITIPTFIIWGEQDTFVHKKIGKAIAQHVPHASYIEISGGTHKLPYEHPEIFAEKVLKFISN